MRYVAGGRFALVLLLLAPSQLFAQTGTVAATGTPGPTGIWDMTIAAPTGPTSATLTLGLNGDALTGDLKSQLGSAPVSGTLNGSDIALTANLDLQGTSFKLGISGTFKDDQIVGSVKAGDFGDFPFTAKRGAAVADPPTASSPLDPSPAAPPAPPAGDVSGKWDAVLSIAGLGDLQAAMTLQQDADKITGLLSSPLGEIKITGAISGNTVKLGFVTETPMGPIPIAMTGDLGADGLAGIVSVPGMGEAAWKATRAK